MSITFRNKVNFAGGVGLASCALVTKDIPIPWSQFFLSASGISGLSGSVVVNTFSSSNIAAMRFTNTAATCPVWATTPIPTDAATSGSGTLWIDWADITTGAAIAAVAASVYAVSGTVIGSGSTLMASTGACLTAGAAASAINSTSFGVQFNAPAITGSGLFVLKLKMLSGSSSDDTSGSNFHLLGARLRYVSNVLGGQGTP